jgi:uncharacterized protein
MRRDVLDKLVEWKNRSGKKPLILRGARQVGKTWLLQEFGKRHYQNYAYVNLEEATQLQSLFITDFDVARIINVLEIHTGEKIIPGETLIILDEIQSAERAITSLKYFHENAPGYHIAAAGSLLGISMPHKSPFPVGKVDFLDLHPLSFSEFLDAAGEGSLNGLLLRKDWSSIGIFKDKFINYLKTYYYTGGMPEVVSKYFQNKDYGEVKTIQQEIISSYEADFLKHAPNDAIAQIRMVWQSIPAQLAKENKKFVYGKVRKGGRSKDFELAIQWLCDAGLLLRNNRITKPEMPLNAFEEMSVFKLYLLDVGLLSAMCGLQAQTLIEGNELFLQYKGALTEQFVMQQLSGLNLHRITYWTNDKSTSEVDFVIQRGNDLIPIEVKAEVNVKAKSFSFFVDKYNLKTAIRFSLRDYKQESWMTNIPLYAVEHI